MLLSYVYHGWATQNFHVIGAAKLWCAHENIKMLTLVLEELNDTKPVSLNSILWPRICTYEALGSLIYTKFWFGGHGRQFWSIPENLTCLRIIVIWSNSLRIIVQDNNTATSCRQHLPGPPTPYNCGLSMLYRIPYNCGFFLRVIEFCRQTC